MKSGKQKYLYIAYVIGIGIWFLYTLFPSETARVYIQSRIARAIPDVKVTMADVKPSFPLGLKFDQVSVEHKGRSVLDSADITVSPAVLALFTGKAAVDIGCSAFEGGIDARIFFTGFNMGKIALAEITLDQIQLDAMGPLKELMNHDLSGQISGKVFYDQSGESRSNGYTGDLVAQDFHIQFASPFHGLDQLRLQQIEASFSMDQNQVKINRFVNKGGDVDGSLSGTILLRRRIENSVLNLNGTVSPNPEFADKLGKLGPIVKRLLKRNTGGGLPVKLKGTFERPRFF